MQQELSSIPEPAIPSGRAAQYVRMSTDQQKYSTQNQADVIAAYAASRRLKIVRTYADEGLSGLGIGWRDGLKAAIADVESGRADFDCILVYDVSRWGRFQDVDESAYYEFICKRAGITVHYCADEFENDGSLASIILKNVKRVGAADYSRQLSKKVFLGQCRSVRMGFWCGGSPGYGLRRQLLDEHGEVRALLESGQRKFLVADRVALVHGPEDEVLTVRRIFTSFVDQGKYAAEIASELNADRIQTARGTRWTDTMIWRILGNEKYAGSIVFNRVSHKLKQKRVDNPREMWLRKDNALPSIISTEIFSRAQAIMRTGRQQRSDRAAVERLAVLGREKGYLTRAMIAAAEDILSAESYRRRFGSLVAACKLAGYQLEPHHRRAESETRYRSLLKQVASEIVRTVEKCGRRATFNEESCLLCVNDGCCISFGTARAISIARGRICWKIYIDRKARSDVTLVVRMDASNVKIAAYYLLPTADLARTMGKIRISNPSFAGACRYDSLEAFSRVCAGIAESAA